MMPAPGSEAQSPTRLRATPIGDADFDGLAFFLSGAGLPIGDLKEPGRVFYRVEADNLVGYEIGRASSRERVCQYVEISVVAVSVKKRGTDEHVDVEIDNKKG